MGRESFKEKQRHQLFRPNAQSRRVAQTGRGVSRMSLLRKQSGESGGSNLGCFLTFLIVGALAYGAYKFVPPYVTHYQLQDAMKEIATLSAVGMLPPAKTSSGRSSGPVSDVQEAVL